MTFLLAVAVRLQVEDSVEVLLKVGHSTVATLRYFH